MPNCVQQVSSHLNISHSVPGALLRWLCLVTGDGGRLSTAVVGAPRLVPHVAQQSVLQGVVIIGHYPTLIECRSTACRHPAGMCCCDLLWHSLLVEYGLPQCVGTRCTDPVRPVGLLLVVRCDARLLVGVSQGV